MVPLKAILCPIDFSKPASYALDAAAVLAHDHAACPIVLHVVRPSGRPLPSPRIEDWKSRMSAEIRHLTATNPGLRELRVETRTVRGDPASCIIDVARQVNADMIVMGTHGRSGVGRLLLGSVAESVSRKAPCLVMTVKAGIAPLSMTTTPVPVHG